VPGWATDLSVGFKAFNARAETIAERPMFRSAYKSQRCIVPISEFYEWRKPDKQPFAFGMADGSIMALAGLWERWKSPQGEIVQSFTIVTTTPNALMIGVHDRMPVILGPHEWPAWLDETLTTPAQLNAIFAPFPSGLMTSWPVSERVGDVRTDDPSLIEPVAITQPLF
jgi:putative SOS response-associated peptidase YedK